MHGFPVDGHICICIEIMPYNINDTIHCPVNMYNVNYIYMKNKYIQN